MKKILVLALVMVLVGCTTVPAAPEIPEFARQVNGHVWLSMPPEVQVVFLFGFACGQCEMTIWLDELGVWEELSESELTFREVAERITQYYAQTGRLDDSVLMVFRIVVMVAVEQEEPESIPGGV